MLLAVGSNRFGLNFEAGTVFLAGGADSDVSGCRIFPIAIIGNRKMAHGVGGAPCKGMFCMTKTI